MGPFFTFAKDERTLNFPVHVKSHLHQATAMYLRRRSDITLKSIPCVLVCTVTLGRSDVTATSLPNGFATHLGVMSQ